MTDPLTVVVGKPPPDVLGLLARTGRFESATPVRLAGGAARRASLVMVAQAEGVLPALLSQRLYGVPWVAVVDDEMAESVLSDRRRSALLGQAGALIASAGTTRTLAEAMPHARWVDRSLADRVASTLADVAQPPAAWGAGGADERGVLRRVLGTGLAGWQFVDRRAERLAIRLVALTGKAPEPIHPKHLVPEAPWHYWYEPHVAAGARVLDVGCSDGAHLLRLAGRLESGLGVDVSARALEHAGRSAARAGHTHLAFERGDLSDPATLERQPSAAYDVVLLLDVLEHIIDRDLVLRALLGRLRPGGRLLVAVPNVDTRWKGFRDRWGGFVYADPDHKLEYTEAVLTAELEDAGFEVVELSRAGIDSPFTGLSALIAPVSLRLYRRVAALRAERSARRPYDASALRAVAVRPLHEP